MSYRIELAHGASMVSELAHDDTANRHNIGDKVVLNFRGSDATLVPGVVKAG
jgi:hypothetical protein